MTASNPEEVLRAKILHERFPYVALQDINRPVTVHWFDVLRAIDTALAATSVKVQPVDLLDLEPWTDYHGDLPDYDHPLRPVYESGIQYAVELLAKELGVESYDCCDGTEEFDGDLGGTMMNIVREALPLDEHGERMWPSEVHAALSRHSAPLVKERGDG